MLIQADLIELGQVPATCNTLCYESEEEKDDANEASKDVINIPNNKVKEKEDVANLSNKVENRAEQLAIARAADPVKSDSVQTGTAKPLEDGSRRKIVAPERKEDSENTSEDKTKAKILSNEARGGTETEKSGYTTEQPATSLNDKVEVPHEETIESEEIEILSDNTGDSKKQEEILQEAEEAFEKDEEEGGMMLSYLIALERTGHGKQAETETKMDNLSNKAGSGKVDKNNSEVRPAEAPQKTSLTKLKSSSHKTEADCKQRGKETLPNSK